jgi:hypothetical protein
MKDGLCVGDTRQEAADGETVSAQDGPMIANNLLLIEAIGLVKRASQQVIGNIETDVAKICRGREAMFADLVNIERELDADMGVGVLVIGNNIAITASEAGKGIGNGEVYCL